MLCEKFTHIQYVHKYDVHALIFQWEKNVTASHKREKTSIKYN